MMNGSINLEEAANVASEFIYSQSYSSIPIPLLNLISIGLDNLPHEVAHILQEIKHKEKRAHGLSFNLTLRYI
jgi:chromatin modification-related protein YNG2